MSREEEFERRLADLERSVAEIQRTLSGESDHRDWLFRVVDAVRDVEGFEEVLRLGREHRHADHPRDEGEEGASLSP